MAEALYEKFCDTLTGVCYIMDTVTGLPVKNADGTPYVKSYEPSVRTPDTSGPLSALYPGGIGPAPAPERIAVTDEGQALPALTGALPSLGSLTEQPVTGGYSSTDAGDWSPYGSGYSRYGSRYGGYSSGGYGGGYGSSGYDGGGTAPPMYANGTLHPYFGGQMPVPGGMAAMQDDGYDDRIQVTSTSGATAGPYGVRAAPAPSQNAMGGSAVMENAYRSGTGGGGGGIAKDLYWQMANKIKAKFGGGDSGSYGGDYAYPKPEKIKPYLGPDDPRTAKKVDKLNDARDSQSAFYTHPEYAIPKGVNLDSPMGQRMMGLQGAQLALMAGAGIKGWKGGIDPTEKIYSSYYQKLGKKLEAGKQGIDFFPYYKKALAKDKSIDQYRGMLQGIYNGVSKGQALDTEALFGNLSSPAKGTYLRKQFNNKLSGMSADTYLDSFSAIANSGEYGTLQAQALQTIAAQNVAKYGQRFAGQNPRRTPSMNRWVGNRMNQYF